MESETVSTKQKRIAELARIHPKLSFTSLAHHIDLRRLYKAYKRTRKDGAVGEWMSRRLRSMRRSWGRISGTCWSVRNPEATKLPRYAGSTYRKVVARNSSHRRIYHRENRRNKS